MSMLMTRSFTRTGNPRGFHATWARRLRQLEKPPGVSRSRNLGASFDVKTGNPLFGFALTQPGRVVCVNSWKPPGVSTLTQPGRVVLTSTTLKPLGGFAYLTQPGRVVCVNAAEQIIRGFRRSRSNLGASFASTKPPGVSALTQPGRVVCNFVHKVMPITPILKELHWLPVSQRIVFKLMLIVRKRILPGRVVCVNWETPGGFALTQPGRVVCVNGRNPKMGFRAHATWARRFASTGTTPRGFTLTQPGRVVCVNGSTPGGFARVTQPGRVVCVNGKPPGVSRSRNLGASFASTANPRGFRAGGNLERVVCVNGKRGFRATQPGRVVCVNAPGGFATSKPGRVRFVINSRLWRSHSSRF